MKTRILTLALSLATVMAFSQKKEIRNAEDAIEEGNYAQAQTLLEKVEPQIAGESDNTKQDFYRVKALAFLGAADGRNTSPEDLMTAAEAYNKLKEVGGKENIANNGILAVRNAFINAAIADQKEENYKAASDKLYKSYQLGKQDTIYLFYAASNAINSKDYDTALKYYSKLMEMGYEGAEKHYIATNKATGEVKTFASKSERDLFVKTGEYIKPEIKTTDPKTGEIAKNIVLIYMEQDKPELAMKAMKTAKEANPNDMGLLQAEANMYYEMGKIETYNQLMKEIVQKDPENATLYYNLAVSSSQMGDDEGAIQYYKKAIEYAPEMKNAYINLAATILKGENELLDGMNQALADGDNTKYDDLAAKRKVLYEKALPYLEKAHEIQPDSVEIIRTMMNIQYVLGNTAKAEALEAKLKALEE